MLCDVCVLGTHGGPVCCHGRSTCARGKLGPTPGSEFVRSTRCSILKIWASRVLLMVSKSYQKSHPFRSSLYRIYTLDSSCWSWVNAEILSGPKPWICHGRSFSTWNWRTTTGCVFRYRQLIDNTILVAQETIARYRNHFLGCDENPEVDLDLKYWVSNRSQPKWQECSYSHCPLTPPAITKKPKWFTDICFARPNCQQDCRENFGRLDIGLVLTNEWLLEKKIEKPDWEIKETLEERNKTYDLIGLDWTDITNEIKTETGSLCLIAPSTWGAPSWSEEELKNFLLGLTMSYCWPFLPQKYHIYLFWPMFL